MPPPFDPRLLRASLRPAVPDFVSEHKQKMKYLAAHPEGMAHLEREICELSLYEFMRRGWKYIEPCEFTEAWHVKAICQHLEAVSRGEIRRLLITVPPRHCKSLSISVAWPAWVWAQELDPDYPLMGPAVQWLNSSYAQTLSERDSLKTRRLVESPWYRQLWGDRVKIVGDMNTKRRYETTAGGYRIATSVGGSLTGEGGSIILIDDPLNATSANSAADRAAMLTWFSEAMQSRLNDQKTGAFVIVQQRLHEEDLAGHVLDQGGYVHLNLPSRYMVGNKCRTSIGWEDPREEEGEPLWPEKIGEKELDQLESSLGLYAFNAQYQQTPSPKGGGIFKEEWWNAWPPPEWNRTDSNGKPQFPDMEFIVASLDSAYTEKEENDPSALTIWGVWRDPGERHIIGQGVSISMDKPKLMLMYGWEKRLTLHGPPEEIPPGVTLAEWNSKDWLDVRKRQWGLVEWVADTCKRYNVDLLLIEAKASGLSVAQEMERLYRNAKFGTQLITPKGDKVARAYSIVHLFSNGQVYAPTEKAWCDNIIRQMSSFPKAKHDDLCDSATQALQYLRDTGMALRSEESEEVFYEENTFRFPTTPLYDI